MHFPYGKVIGESSLPPAHPPSPNIQITKTNPPKTQKSLEQNVRVVGFFFSFSFFQSETNQMDKTLSIWDIFLETVLVCSMLRHTVFLWMQIVTSTQLSQKTSPQFKTFSKKDIQKKKDRMGESCCLVNKFDYPNVTRWPW